MTDEFDLFANIQTVTSDNDYSFVSNDNFNTSETSVATPSPVAKKKTTSSTRSARKKVASVVYDDDDDDDCEVLEGTPITAKSSMLHAGKGQKSAVKRLEILKRKLANEVNLLCSDDEHEPATASALSYTKAAVRPSKIVASIDLVDDNEDYPKRQLAAPDVFDVENYVMQIKVNWNHKIERIPLRRHQKMKDICGVLAARENINADDIILMLNERLIEPNDTPSSIGYTIGKFVCARRVMTNSASNRIKKKCDSSIEVKIQSALWKKPLLVTINKSELLKVLVIKCAEELKCSPNKVHLSFDGELLDVEATPDTLDLMDGEVFDLRIL